MDFQEDGWFNMTKAANAFGKRLDKFWGAVETKAYLDAACKLTPKGVSFVETRHGRGGGTWAHPKLAVFFARWLDVRFAVWCDSIIDDILRGRVVPQEAPEAPSTGLQVLIDGVDIREVLKTVSRGLDDLSEQGPGHDNKGGQSEHHKGSKGLSV
jgi:hypothetical protein